MIEEVLVYQGITGKACVTSTSASVRVGLPLFLGAGFSPTSLRQCHEPMPRGTP